PWTLAWAQAEEPAPDRVRGRSRGANLRRAVRARWPLWRMLSCPASPTRVCARRHVRAPSGYDANVIEVPGFRILRQLGRGGMATVYLALQESVDREVALKVMSPALLVDPDFGERFLREAKIAARLHHRHVVGIHDVGRSGNYHYIAMEYLAGGAVLPKDGSARDVAFASRIV